MKAIDGDGTCSHVEFVWVTFGLDNSFYFFKYGTKKHVKFNKFSCDKYLNQQL